MRAKHGKKLTAKHGKPFLGAQAPLEILFIRKITKKLLFPSLILDRDNQR